MTEHPQSSPVLSPLKRAYLAIEELQARLAAAEAGGAREPVAIVGVACRFPGGADTPAAFWELLRDGRDAVTAVPADRWPVDVFFDDDPAAPGKMSARHGGFLRGIEEFDAAFFGISPREAASMDPQHRLLLEVAREALTASGQWRERLAPNPMGVFIGITSAEHGQMKLAAEGVAALDAYHITGNSLNAAAGRLAFVFGLHGPCLAVDTACSSSLVALHLAVQSLRTGDCETALAGGVNLILSPLGSVALTKGGVLSSDGRSKAFDAAADGMVRGEGCGLVVLKKLSAARRDGDRVLAVIRGSGVNQDGPSSGLTVPNGPAQEALLRDVLGASRTPADAVDYVEAHGTGTALGDPIEVGALGAVYGAGRAADRPLAIGSVKTNLGHLESAAGIAGVIKVVLALNHDALPASLHFHRPSPHIDWAHLPVRVPTTLQPWTRGDRPRLAAVSAFGFSGTNAHVLLEEPPRECAGAPDDPRGLVAAPVTFKRERIPLPRSAESGGLAVETAHPLLGRELSLAGSDERRFEVRLSAAAPAWLADHRVFETVVVPGAALLELARAAGEAVLGPGVAVSEFAIAQALTLENPDGKVVQTVVLPGAPARRVEIFSRGDQGWVRHVTAIVQIDGSPLAAAESFEDVGARCPTRWEPAAVYAGYVERGLPYGPAFQAIRSLQVAKTEMVAELALADGTAGGFAVHPILLDAALQAAGTLFAGADRTYLPVSAARWVVRSAVGPRVRCQARVEAGPHGAAVTVQFQDPSGAVVAQLDRLMLRRAPRVALRRLAPRRDQGVYQIDWVPLRSTKTESRLSGDWLVIDDADGVAARLAAAGAQVTCVAGAELADTLARKSEWRGVVHTGALRLAGEAPATFDALGIASYQILSRAGVTAPVWIATRGAAPLAGGPVSAPAAAVFAMGRVLQQEHPEWQLRLVDVDGAGAADALVQECATPDAENQIAWRRGGRHGARLVPAGFAEAQPISVTPTATYLVTGGLGALGLVAAGWLIGRGARRVVLAGRHGPGEAVQAQFAAWTAACVRVETRAVDVSDRAQVQQLLAGLPDLRGIVHAAGTIADGAARLLTSAQWTQVLAPKAEGARHLHELAGELDFLVLFSSAASVLGTPGQANYAAANGYLDGLAQQRRAEGKPALAINWGGWNVGLAAGVAHRYAARGLRPITPARGCAELERLIATRATQALVLRVTWKTFLATAAQVPPLLSTFGNGERAAAGVDAAATFRAKVLAAPDRVAAAAEVVRSELARVLRLAPDKLGTDQPLSMLGLDSIMAVDVRNRLRTITGIDIPLVALLDTGGVGSIAQQLAQEISGGAERKGATELVATNRRVIELPEQAAEPLSVGQEALWFLHQAAPTSAAYHTAVALRLRGALDQPHLRRVLEQLTARHPVLRATFALEDGRPVMRMAARVPPGWREVDARGWGDERLRREVAADYERPYALEAGPVFRASLFELAADDHVLLLGVHHIVGDAWTNWVLLDEFRQLYAGEGTLSPVSGTYAEFVRWQQQLLAGAEGQRLWAWWQQELAGELTPLALPLDRPRPAVLTPDGASVALSLPAGWWERLRAFAKERQATPFAVLLAAYQVFLHRHTGQEDIMVGSPTSGRSRPEFAGVAGYFVNPVPLRGRVRDAEPFSELLARAKATVLGALAHADFPLPLLVERLKLPRDPSRPPLFQTLFVFQKPPQTDARGDALKAAEAQRDGWGGLQAAEFPLAQMEGQFELTLELFEDRGGSFKFNTALLAAATVARMAGRFVALVDAIVAGPDAAVGALPLLAREEAALLARWNETPAAYPTDVCLHELLAAQAVRTPDAPAVTAHASTLTYAELDRRANQLAHALRAAGVGPDRLVGVCAERSLELVIALVGVLKAGGAYVPLDPGYPEERLAFMAADSGISLVLTQEALRPKLERVLSRPEKNGHAAAPRVIALDSGWPDIARQPVRPVEVAVQADHLAYMIYTSGSTGRPKGAMNTHRAIVNRLLWMQDRYRLTDADTVMQKTPFSFDVSVWEFFWPLLAGARLLMAKPGGHQDAAYLVELAARERVTTMHFVPSMLQVFVAQPALATCTALRQVFCSGEALSHELQQRFLAAHPAELHNLYGPTEAAVDVSFWHCERRTEEPVVPIGRPIARTQLHVLDRRLQPTPIGVAGELHIGGISLARGYHGRPELTAEKFVPDPFGPVGSRLYRTGDLTRWRADGSIEYLGRLDHQVKIRGFRIELGEIEAALRQQREVRDAVVVAREEAAGEKQLIAYVVAGERAGDEAAWRTALRARLPEYMVPADFVRLAALPLTPSGKVDRRALPAPAREHRDPGATYRPAATPTEEALVGLWREVLGRDRVGVEDNFFDLGGHSLKLGHLHARLQGRFEGVPTLLELFRYPTIRGLAARLEARPATAAAMPARGAGPGGNGAAEESGGRRDALVDQRALRQAARAGRSGR
jgi:amino acid adenylation domain-containing protein